MGNVFKNQKNVEVTNIISKKYVNKYPHLDLKGEIVIRKNNESLFCRN